jgi:hypothetical protein
MADAYLSLIKESRDLSERAGIRLEVQFAYRDLIANRRKFDEPVLNALHDLFLEAPKEPPSGGLSDARVPRPPSGAPHGTASASIEKPKKDDEPN